MKKLLILLIMLTIVLAQGLRLCVHAPNVSGGMNAHSVLIHYESNSDSDTKDTGHDFDVPCAPQGMDTHDLLFGLSAFTLLLIWLRIIASPVRRFSLSYIVSSIPPNSYRLRPPLRAPPF